jgi:flagellar protein FlaI
MLVYPLIPRKPKPDEKIFAFVRIVRHGNEIIYELHEPHLTPDQKKTLEEIKDYIQEKMDVDFRQIKKKEATEYLRKTFENAFDYFKIPPGEIREIFRYYIQRDFIGLEKLEAIMNDPNIEDISCDGIGIPVYVYHRDPKIGSIRTNVVFNNKKELDGFVTKVSERCGKTISIAKPLLNGTLPDGSRVQATLGTDIARQGSNFTIRRFTEKPITPVDIIKFGTADAKTLAFLWLAVERASSVLISGGTATGKTSLLNAIALFIRPEMKIVSIEDTAEIRLTHEHWIPEVARVTMSEKGEVDMYKLLRESLRQRPDYIIVGEVRGREAYVLFQQIAVGHPGLGTIHAENFPKLIDRLTTAPISLPPQLMENLDLIIFLKRIKKEKQYVRRINEVLEVVGFSKKNNEPFVNKVVSWLPTEDKFVSERNSQTLNNVMHFSGMTEVEIKDEIKQRGAVLKWMLDKNITDYKEVSKIINSYYQNKDELLRRVEMGLQL